jgi:mycofactocin precursor
MVIQFRFSNRYSGVDAPDNLLRRAADEKTNFHNEEILKRMEDKTTEMAKENFENKNEDIFLTQEIEIEEMAIDGICGVY